ncbi:MAG: hypothetical protein ACLTHX_10720 [Blautia massiliensis (ex Durand et al. 2017)]|uniref:hypothetical protein n=1 Tax=Blautia massiliensis (ex Durand et al. 2017) TaxID=1737424 RepID=UPI003991913E
MLSVQDPEILFIWSPITEINLFSPAEIKDEELDKLQSNLKEVMLFIKYSKINESFRSSHQRTPCFQSLEFKAARVIDSITRYPFTFHRNRRGC